MDDEYSSQIGCKSSTVYFIRFFPQQSNTIIRLNRTGGDMNEIKRTQSWGKPKRKALTEVQQSAFISYVSVLPAYKHEYLQ